MRAGLVLFLTGLVSVGAGCDRKRAPPPPMEGNPQEAPSAITIANVFGTCEDAGGCEVDCDAGNGDQCRRLGTTYQFGNKSTHKDDTRTLSYYEKACAMKSAGGCVSAGQMYEFHHGVDKDDVKAAAFYKSGCDLGYQVGCANYAIMLENGRGVTKDVAAAAVFYASACRHGAGLACERMRALRDLDAGAQASRDGAAD